MEKTITRTHEGAGFNRKYSTCYTGLDARIDAGLDALGEGIIDIPPNRNTCLNGGIDTDYSVIADTATFGDLFSERIVADVIKAELSIIVPPKPSEPQNMPKPTMKAPKKGDKEGWAKYRAYRKEYNSLPEVIAYKELCMEHDEKRRARNKAMRDMAQNINGIKLPDEVVQAFARLTEFHGEQTCPFTDEATPTIITIIESIAYKQSDRVTRNQHLANFNQRHQLQEDFRSHIAICLLVELYRLHTCGIDIVNYTDTYTCKKTGQEKPSKIPSESLGIISGLAKSLWSDQVRRYSAKPTDEDHKDNLYRDEIEPEPVSEVAYLALGGEGGLKAIYAKAKLKTNERRLIHGRYFAGKSYSDLASIIRGEDTPTNRNWIKTTLARGLNKLRRAALNIPSTKDRLLGNCKGVVYN